MYHMQCVCVCACVCVCVSPTACISKSIPNANGRERGRVEGGLHVWAKRLEKLLSVDTGNVSFL